MKRQILLLTTLVCTALPLIGGILEDSLLSRHDFFYAGQSKQRRMFIVKDGRIAWSYDDQLKRGEISDAVMTSDGHILVAHQYGIAEVTQDQQTVWSYAAPEGTEIHTIQPIGSTHVVFVQNGRPAKVVVMKIPECRIEKEFELPINEKGSVHGQFRNARLSSRGTLLVANMALGCIHEFTSDGKEVDRWGGYGGASSAREGGFLPWSVQEMPKTGNLLITGRKGKIQEINRQGQTVWELNTTDYGVTQPQKTVRLKNGGHIINNWYNEWNKEPMDTANAPVQAIEVDKDGRLVWQLRADAMIAEAVMQLTGEPTAKKAWRALFRHFNKTHGRGNRGYKNGESIAVKLNLNNAITHHDTIELNSSPFVTLALVRSMVSDGGVRQQDIVLCEPSRAITDSIYYKVHREFPLVRMIDNIGGDGREKCEYYPEQIVYSVDNGKMARGLAKCIVDADYLINSALLKTHSGPGVTLTTKNWYGATDINLLWRQNAHNNVSQDKRHGKPGYKTFVDWLSHKDMGQKALLFLIDGTYGSRDVNGAPNPKWMKEPFNGDWACSIIVSQDEVACDAVGMDIIIGEWPEFQSLNYCDEYLREAASLPNAPSGTVYKQQGKPLQQPLGLFEHWNKDHQYTKIDLKYKKL